MRSPPASVELASFIFYVGKKRKKLSDFAEKLTRCMTSVSRTLSKGSSEMIQGCRQPAARHSDLRFQRNTKAWIREAKNARRRSGGLSIISREQTRRYRIAISDSDIVTLKRGKRVYTERTCTLNRGRYALGNLRFPLLFQAFLCKRIRIDRRSFTSAYSTVFLGGKILNFPD